MSNRARRWWQFFAVPILAVLVLAPTTVTSASTKLAVITVHGTPARTVLTAKGNGAGDTAMFIVPASAPYWQANWSYNCHPAGQQGLFDWQVETPTGWDQADYITPNQLGWGYSAAERYYDHGTFYLKVNADQGCVWAIQVVVPSTPTYTVRVDQTWRFLAWTSGNTSTYPLQVKVTFDNAGPGILTLSDDLWLRVGKPGASWTSKPVIADTYTYQCGSAPDLGTQLLIGHTVRPGRSFTGCAVWSVPSSVWPHPNGFPTFLPMELVWAPPGQKPQVLPLPL